MRYTEFEFPGTSYVPGKSPRHVTSDVCGEIPQTPLTRENWQSCPHYLWGIDLFNHGYHWEAHEAWETLWHDAGRRGPLADFLKGLIKLAAAEVKRAEGKPHGADRHLARMRQLVGSLGTSHLCGLSLEWLATSYSPGDLLLLADD
jgi:hypothetical protein